VSLALNSVDELLSALLDISKFDSGAYTPAISDFRIDGILKALVTEHLPQVVARQLTLKWVPCSAVVRSDPVLTSRVLRNFLSNAMRYTPEGGILMGCRRRRDGVEIQVWDSGIGIPREKWHDIFEEFHRLSTDSHAADRGIGLGLAIVDRIARCLNHEIRVRSTLGEGSMFSILLPFGRIEEQTPQDGAFHLPQGLDRVAGKSLLVIENDPAELNAMQALLEAWHCSVMVAADADAAITQLRLGAIQPDIILADYHLDRDETGLEALRAIQALFQQRVPGIVITADRTDEIQNEVQAAGYYLLNKPLKPARLRSLIGHVATGDPVG
jgi:CheY-like chemotaxis protein